MTTIRKLAFTGIIIVLLIYMLQPLLSTFSGSHSIEKEKNSTDYGLVTICARCHMEEVYLNNLSVHRVTGCVCHGYAPNSTQAFNINAQHNLTKNIYCTNCHTDYNDNGIQEIYTGITTPNQSGHYIKKNSTINYDHAQKMFSGN